MTDNEKILQEKIEAYEREQERRKIAEELAKQKKLKWQAWLVFGVPIIGIMLWGGFSDGGSLKEMFIDDKTPAPTSNCRGTASTYVMPFDGKTYTYSCNEATGVWAYTDRFNDPSCNLIKGNIAFESGEKIYHVKGQTYYDDTKIDLEYGERWFCSEQEAISAGWRKSYE